MKNIFKYLKEFAKGTVNLIMCILIFGVTIYIAVSDVSAEYILDFLVFVEFYLISLVIQNGSLKYIIKNEDDR